jgi:hypothetical protein
MYRTAQYTRSTMVIKTNELMMYKAKVAVCSAIRTKHSTQGEHHVEFLNVKPGDKIKKPLGFKRLNVYITKNYLQRLYISDLTTAINTTPCSLFDSPASGLLLQARMMIKMRKMKSKVTSTATAVSRRRSSLVLFFRLQHYIKKFTFGTRKDIRASN